MTDELNTTPPPPPPGNGDGDNDGEPGGAASSTETSPTASAATDMPGPPPPSPGGAAPPPPPPSGAGGGGTDGPGGSEPAGGGSNGNRTLMLVLAYLGPLAFVPFFAAQDDPEVHWHSKNGLVLFATEVAIWFVLALISMSGFLSCLSCFASIGLTVALFIVHVWCIVSALNGKRPILPGLSQFADSF